MPEHSIASGGNTSGHVRPESVFGYEHHLLSPEELRALHAHVAGCPACRRLLGERVDVSGMVTDVRSELAPASKVRLFATAAAVIVLVAVGAMWLMQRRPEPTSVQEALSTGRIPLPEFVAGLRTPAQVLMGQPSSVSPQLLSPKATAVLEPTVQFRWQALEPDATYQVRVFTLSGEEAAASPEIRDLRWICDRGLSTGSDYQWQITVTGRVGKMTLPPASEAPPRFRILDASSADRVRMLARTKAGDHLLLGVEFGRAGLLEDAHRELEEAIRQNPGRKEIRRLLESLR